MYDGDWKERQAGAAAKERYCCGITMIKLGAIIHIASVATVLYLYILLHCLVLYWMVGIPKGGPLQI